VPPGLSESLQEMRVTPNGFRDKFSPGELSAAELPAYPGVMFTVALRNEGSEATEPNLTYCRHQFAISPSATAKDGCSGHTPDGWCVANAQEPTLCEYHGKLSQADCTIEPGQTALLTTVLEGVSLPDGDDDAIRLYVGYPTCDGTPEVCVFDSATQLR
jgi:hypothetical protein